MPFLQSFDQNLFDRLDLICLQHEQDQACQIVATSGGIQQDDLGNFDSIWQYLHPAGDSSLRTGLPSTKFDTKEPGNDSLLVKQSKKRDARKARRRLAHELREATVETFSPEDTPDLGDYTSASDLDITTLSEDEATKEERLSHLRDTLEFATKAFQNSPMTMAKRSKISDKNRTISVRHKLAKNFPDEDHLALSSPSRSPPKVAFLEKSWNKRTTEDSPATCKTHIFIDSSNIFLGFQDLLQKTHPHCYPAYSHRKPVMDLHILNTILERGRQSSRKTLVGSSPLLQNWEPIAIHDYQISILERVSRSDNPQHRKEQGVDELLHLQMMESIFDCEPGVMVLASGDANVAQFSAGFHQVVVRALGRGWRVEVVGFRKSMNRLWLDAKFRNEFGTRFKVIYLDDYVDELEM